MNFLPRNSVRFQPAGPKGGLTQFSGFGQPVQRRYAEGGRVSALDVIKEELPKWWKSDETSDLRKGLRQTALAPAYMALPGLASLAMLGPELYDAFAREPEDYKRSPTVGSFSWVEKQLGRDLEDPIEEEMSLASGLAQMAPIARALPKLAKKILSKPASASRDIPIDEFLKTRSSFVSDEGIPVFHATDADFDIPRPGTWFTPEIDQIEAGRFGSKVKAYTIPKDVDMPEVSARGVGFKETVEKLTKDGKPIIRIKEEISGMDPSISYVVNDPSLLKSLRPSYADGGKVSSSAMHAFLNL